MEGLQRCHSIIIKDTTTTTKRRYKDVATKEQKTLQHKNRRCEDVIVEDATSKDTIVEEHDK
jgi:hypothetical protein